MATTTRSGWKYLKTGKALRQFGIPGKMQIFRETLVRATSHADDLSSEISFIPPNHNFTVGYSLSAANSAGFDIAVHGAVQSGGSFSLIKDDLIDAAASTLSKNAIYKADPANSSPEAQMPFYKLFVDGDAAFGNGDTITLYVMIAPKGTELIQNNLG